MKEYNHVHIESKWQKIWDEKKIHEAKENSKKPKFYALIEFPFLSGDGLHVGHIRSYTAMDVIARKRRAEGFNVLYPIGYDAFGLPIENFAIKTGKSPILVVKNTVSTFRRQLKLLGFSFDWSREFATSDPFYYKWTQWIFLKFFEKGLAYKKKMAINWCPKDKIGLANEEVVEGKCERCGTAVEKREKEQWMLAITKYADRLDGDLDHKKILIGTRNPAKVKMLKACLAGVSGIELISLDDIPQIDDSGLIEGDDFLENAKKKSEFYFKKTGIPTIATDHILWIEKWPENKGFMIHMRKHANPQSSRATDEEVVTFLKNFLKKVGGSSRANFHYAISYTDEAGTLVADEVPGHYILQDKEQAKNYWPGYPTEALLKDVQTGVFKSEQSDDIRYAKITRFLKEKFVSRMFRGRTPVDFLEKIKIQQRNWIGRSEGSLIVFELKTKNYELKTSVEVFTTRADTLFGATYLVLAPDHPLIAKIENQLANKDEVVRYIVQTKNKTEMERTAADKDKSGVELKGVKAINPATKEEIPVWVADYVLADYGTGAIMAVPAHDERDFEFAKKFNLPIKEVVLEIFGEKKKDGIRRDSVAAVVTRPSDNKILILYNRATNEHQIPGGGYESNEDDLTTLAREIKEESGYTDFEVKEYLGQIQTNFFVLGKNVNRIKHQKSYHVVLRSEKTVDLKPDEHEDFERMWLTPEEAIKKLDSDKHISYESEFVKRFIKLTPRCFSGEGILANSGKFDGMESEKTKKMITEFVGGKIVITYKLRDWVFSRQRYWGEPIPLVFCEDCKKSVGSLKLKTKNLKLHFTEGELRNPGWVPVPEKDLPIKLPKVKNYKPTDTGESPLADIKKWVNVKCPKCKGVAKRETDTMPNWAGSSWYYLAYAMHKNLKSKILNLKFSSNLFRYWLPVDWYNGGMEHTTLHLLYSRFWHKFLFDLGLVPTNEPYSKRTSHGLILAEGGVKMSKSKSNVVNPDALIKSFGADTLRLYEMFMGPFDQHIVWSTESMVGPRRFLERVWKLKLKIKNEKLKNEDKTNLSANSLQLETTLHKTIKKVSGDIEAMRFNTAVSAMMVLLNEFEKASRVSRDQYKIFLQLLAPFAPHISEELWSSLGQKISIQLEPWPVYDEKLSNTLNKVLVIQVNGKTRGSVSFNEEILSEHEAKALAFASEEIKKWILRKEIKRVVYIKNRLLNIVF